MIAKVRPNNFAEKFEITGSFIISDGKILLLHRIDEKPEGNTWGLPAGKRNANEALSTTIVREVLEETGLEITKGDFHFLGTYFNRYPTYDFLFHLFTTTVKSYGKIQINPHEHKAYQWVTPEDALRLPLIEDLDHLIREHFSHENSS